MQRSEWDFENRIDDDEHDAALPESSEVLADRFGIRTALLVLCIALFIAAIWVTSRPSFEKCSALESVTERNAYDGLSVCGEAHGDAASALTAFRLTCPRLLPQASATGDPQPLNCAALILHGDNSPSGMSALGHRRTLTRAGRMSASPPKTCRARSVDRRSNG